MSARIAVVADLPEYAVAVAGLPERTERADRVAGAIVVVDGATAWWDAAALAVADGASAVLVAEPQEVPVESVAELAAAASGVPIVVRRARLRHDLVAVAAQQRGGVAPRVVVSECRAAARELPAMIRDAVGWTRVFAAEPLVVASASVGRGTATALFRGRVDGRVVGSLVAAVTEPKSMVLRVQALGEVTTEVEIDAPLGVAELATSTAAGRLVAPARFESGERVALRRAVELVAQGGSSRDLDDLLHDDEVASAVLGAEWSPHNL